MLTQEELQKRLESVMIKPWIEQRMDAMKDLDESTRKIGNLLIGREKSGTSASEMRRRGLHRKVNGQLEKVPEQELLRLGDRILANRTDVFSEAWKLHEQTPVQSGGVKLAFRAPTRPLAYAT